MIQITDKQAAALVAWAGAKTTGFGPKFTDAFMVAQQIRFHSPAMEWVSLREIRNQVFDMIPHEIDQFAADHDLDLRTRAAWLHLLSHAFELEIES